MRTALVYAAVLAGILLSACATLPQTEESPASVSGVERKAASGTPASQANIQLEREPLDTAQPDSAAVLHVGSRATNAAVRINGQAAGYTPVRIPLRNPGQHFIELKAQGYADISTWITISQGESVTAQLNPRRLGGTLTVETAPAVDNAVEGVEVSIPGYAPYSPGMFLPEGRYSLRVRAFGYQTAEISLDMQDGAEILEVVQLEVAGFQIRDVYVNRRLTGTADTPAMSAADLIITASAPGSASVRIYSPEGDTLLQREIQLQQRLTRVPLPSSSLPIGKHRIVVGSAEEHTEELERSLNIVPGQTRRTATTPVTGSVRPPGSFAAAARISRSTAADVPSYAIYLDFGLPFRTAISLRGGLHDNIPTGQAGLRRQLLRRGNRSVAVNTAVTLGIHYANSQHYLQLGLPISTTISLGSLIAELAVNPYAQLIPDDRQLSGPALNGSGLTGHAGIRWDGPGISLGAYTSLDRAAVVELGFPLGGSSGSLGLHTRIAAEHPLWGISLGVHD